MNDRCPTCNQSWPGKSSRRVCSECGGPILRHHKFIFDGSKVRHRVCGDPTSYSENEPKPVPLLEVRA
jgi:ssDNA-binding Zn-finger/Zn-ribbon topoisomerase 1